MARRKQSVRSRGKAKHKGARGQAAKTKTRSRTKTKAKTATRHVRKSQQKVAMEKATAPVDSPTLDNREIEEAAPAAVGDIEDLGAGQVSQA
jgi:hypothetical protein